MRQRYRPKDYVEVANQIPKLLERGPTLQCVPLPRYHGFVWKNHIPLWLRPPSFLSNGKAVYWLTGARLVSYKGSPAYSLLTIRLGENSL